MKLKKPKSFTISRKWWQRGGKKPGGTLLLNDQGYCCCLGFYTMACGCTDDEIRGRGSPGELADIAGLCLPGMVDRADHDSTTTCVDLVEANDSLSFSREKVRESRIAQLFRKIGVRVRFVK